MNNYKKNLFTFLSAYFLALTVFAVMPCRGAKSHDNYIKFYGSGNTLKKFRHDVAGQSPSYTIKKVMCVTFQLTDYCITSKQPFSPRVNDFLPRKGNSTTLIVSAGRKHSSRPANCFNNWTDKRNVFGKNAHSLNFALKGTMKLYNSSDCNSDSLLATFYNMALGQGHSFAANNWWIGGGEKCKYVDNDDIDDVECTSEEGDKWNMVRHNAEVISLVNEDYGA